MVRSIGVEERVCLELFVDGEDDVDDRKVREEPVIHAVNLIKRFIGHVKNHIKEFSIVDSTGFFRGVGGGAGVIGDVWASDPWLCVLLLRIGSSEARHRVLWLDSPSCG